MHDTFTAKVCVLPSPPDKTMLLSSLSLAFCKPPSLTGMPERRLKIWSSVISLHTKESIPGQPNQQAYAKQDGKNTLRGTQNLITWIHHCSDRHICEPCSTFLPFIFFVSWPLFSPPFPLQTLVCQYNGQRNILQEYISALRELATSKADRHCAIFLGSTYMLFQLQSWCAAEGLKHVCKVLEKGKTS